MNEIYISLIGGLTTIITTIIATFQALKLKKIEKTKTEIKTEIKNTDIKIDALSYVTDFSVLNGLINIVNDICKNTPVDRFLILYGVNGKEAIDTVSVIFQMENGKWAINAVNKYKDLSTDTQYKMMLKNIEQNDDELIVVDEMENCMLKSLYEREGVKYSLVKFITRKSLNEENDLILYSSFASHTHKILKKDISYIASKCGLLKKLITQLN